MRFVAAWRCGWLNVSSCSPPSRTYVTARWLISHVLLQLIGMGRATRHRPSVCLSTRHRKLCICKRPETRYRYKDSRRLIWLLQFVFATCVDSRRRIAKDGHLSNVHSVWPFVIQRDVTKTSLCTLHMHLKLSRKQINPWMALYWTKRSVRV